MKASTRRFALAVIAAATKSHAVAAFAGAPRAIRHQHPSSLMTQQTCAMTTRLYSGLSASDIPTIDKGDLQDILESLQASGREGSGYCVMDVRNPDEVSATGPLGPSVNNLPLSLIVNGNIFSKSEEEFEAVAQFTKPSLDEMLVFSCAAGKRSAMASLAAAEAGYSNILNYSGGANDWFNKS
ncbi:hypothetical protein MPSEU_000812600 [Mayamaea pseudoterrestris]|nr:hypothetical protein MPSEU_000812600 [Mayamaea pseudoterrestris]